MILESNRESYKAYKQIDLHFHDLRHEAGSRWLERGVPLHHIKNLLGHANISQTDTYLNAGTVDLQKAILEAESRAESGPNVAQTEIGAIPQKQEKKPNPAIN